MGAINAVTDLSVDDGIAIVTLNSPPVNALSQKVREAFRTASRRRTRIPTSKASC